VLWQDKIFHLNISLIEYAAAMKKKPGVPASSKWEAFDEGHRRFLALGRGKQSLWGEDPAAW